METCRRTSLLRWVGAAVGICCLIATLWFTARVNDLPDYNNVCTLCVSQPGLENCSCPTTEDICLWGVQQKFRWERIYAFLIMCLMASYSFALIVELWLKYSLASKQTQDFISGITTALQRNRVQDAVNMAALYPESPVAVVVNASFQDCRTHWKTGIAGIDRLEASTQTRQRAIVFVTERMKRGLWAIEAFGWAVPLVSLFLTVSGVILALKGMRAAEGTGISAIAGGLAESLWPMAFAVLATIPIVWSHKYLTSKLGTLLLEGEKLSLAIIHDIMDRRHSVPSLSRQYATQELDPRDTLKLPRLINTE